MKHLLRLSALALLVAPQASQACTVCMGDPSSKTAGAINAAIFVMIGCIFAMLASLGAFAFYLARRAAAPMPPHAVLGINADETEENS